MRAMLLASMLAMSGCDPAVGEEQPAPELATPQANPIAARVESAILHESTAMLSVSLPGEIVGSGDALLAAALGGYVESVAVEMGDVVQKGQELARIDAEIHAATVDQTEAQLALARGELERITALDDLASASAIQTLSTQVAVAEASVRQARARLARAVIRAPFAGTVGFVAVEQGEVANPGAPVVRLVSLDPVVVSVSVSDRDIGMVKQGMTARISTSAAGDLRDGVVSVVSPVADSRTRTFIAEIEVQNPDHRLLPGMIARVELARATEASIVLPQEWIVTRLDGYGVFVVSDGAAQWRSVVLGDVIHEQVIVVDGLVAGDEVVMTGHQSLLHGDPITVTRQGRCCDHGRVAFGRDQSTAAAQ